MGLNQLACNRQAHSPTTLLARVKWIEDPTAERQWDAWPIVGENNLDRIVVAREADANAGCFDTVQPFQGIRGKYLQQTEQDFRPHFGPEDSRIKADDLHLHIVAVKQGRDILPKKPDLSNDINGSAPLMVARGGQHHPLMFAQPVK
jgi:hypothetical protein